MENARHPDTTSIEVSRTAPPTDCCSRAATHTQTNRETPQEAAGSICDALDFLCREADAAGLDDVSGLLQEASAKSRTSGALPATANPADVERRATSPPGAGPPALDDRPGSRPAIATPLWRRPGLVIGLATVGAAAVAFAFLLPPAPLYEASFATTVGQHREIRLPDDSLLRLNTDSAVTVRYTYGERHIELRRGEAHFDVAHAPERPFRVAAGSGTVRALGTAFNVYLHSSAVRVTVDEGTVEVEIADAPVVPQLAETAELTESAEAAVETRQTLSEGQTLEYRDTIGPVTAADPSELARQLAWREGMLDFHDRTLAEIVAEAGRHTATEITIVDPEIERLIVTGYIRAGDVDTLLALIEANEGVAVRRLGAEHVQITAAPPAP